jgi:hypothetical protein
MSGHHHSVFSIDTKPWARPRCRPGRIGEMLAISLIAVSLLGSGAMAEELPADPLEFQASEPGLPSGEELSKLLPLLLTSPERKAVAAEIEGLIRSGDLKTAEARLNAAIDAGTLAIVLVNTLSDPGLLQTLQSLGIRGGDQPSAAPPAEVASAASCPIPPASASTDLLEAQQALEQEKAHGSASRSGARRRRASLRVFRRNTAA